MRDSSAVHSNGNPEMFYAWINFSKTNSVARSTYFVYFFFFMLLLTTCHLDKYENSLQLSYWLISYFCCDWIQLKFRSCKFTLRMYVCYLHSGHHPQNILVCKYTWRNAWCWCSMHHRGSYVVLFHTHLQYQQIEVTYKNFFLPLPVKLVITL